jgi:hypothetical protein
MDHRVRLEESSDLFDVVAVPSLDPTLPSAWPRGLVLGAVGGAVLTDGASAVNRPNDESIRMRR